MASTFLTRTIGSATGTTKGTFSCWVKRGNLGSAADCRMFSSWGSSSSQFWIIFQTDTISIADYDGSYNLQYVTNRVFRDTSAWYHIVVAIDTTQGTSGDRVKLYVNGVRETSFSTSTAPSQDQVLNFSNNGEEFRIGKRDSEEYLDGSMTHIHFTDGYAYAASDFGETDSTSGIWIAKTSPSVTYGNNGFFLKFENSAAMGTDSSGNSNTFAVSGSMTQNVDTPSNNFATINPLYYSTSQSTLSNGNLTATSSGANWNNFHSTLAPSTGKWYWEVKVVNVGSNTHPIGIVGTDDSELNKTSLSDAFDNGTTGISYVQTGDKDVAGSRTSYGNSYTTGDIIGVAMDLDNLKLYFSKNGTYQNSGVPTSGSTGTGAISIVSGHSYLASFAHYNTMVDSINFGQGFFGTTAVASANADANGHGAMEYAVPSGYYTLNTKNIKEFG